MEIPTEKTTNDKNTEKIRWPFSKRFSGSRSMGLVPTSELGSRAVDLDMFYLFSVVATGVWINWSIAGCLLLLTLFKGSSDFSEAISAEKYPDYQEYQKEGSSLHSFF